MEADNRNLSNEESKNETTQNDFTRAHEIEIEDEEDVNWYELRVDGRQPERRAYHSAFIHEEELFIFGGHDIREGQTNSLWSFDLGKIGTLPNPRPEHALDWQKIETNGFQKPGK